MALSVLVVDDHPSFRSAASKLLAAAGYDVVGDAEDGATAMAAVRELRPDLVLLDVQLPDRDGFSIAAELAEQLSPPRVVLVSGRRATDYGDRLPAAGAVGFIHKPQLSGRLLQELLSAPGDGR